MLSSKTKILRRGRTSDYQQLEDGGGRCMRVKLPKQKGTCVGLAGATAVAFMIATPWGDAQARLVRITVQPPAVIDLPAFGPTGRYLKISGTFEGELDPADPRNAVIADIALAPRIDGKVRYTSAFYMLRPADLGKGNRKIFYDFGNRGNKRILQWFNDGAEADDPATAADFGNGFLMRHGYAVAWSGWGGDVAAVPNMMSIDLPVARNPDGSSIEGPVVAEFEPAATDRTRIALPYAATMASATNGVLTVRQHEADPRVPIADWSYVNARQIEFPGPAHVQWI